MGSSKKHKRDKESKKRKHRSQSRSPPSPSPEREKPRRHHKKHRRRERSCDVEEVPVDSHLPSHSHYSETPTEKSPSPPSTPTFGTHGDAASLSIEETNRLRAKLGLKPLQVTEEKDADDGKITDDLGEFYHKPAANISEKKKTDKIQARLMERKEKRKIEERLLSGVRGLGSDSESDERADSWVKRSRELAAQKWEAEKRAAMLDELDAEFGVGALVGEEELAERGGRYDARQLAGLRVAHELQHADELLAAGRPLVLTLQDKQLLAEDDEDVLVNVNMLDDERYRKSNENKKMGRQGYQAYTDEGDATGSHLLAKYDSDDERRKGFMIGDEDGIEAAAFRKMMVKEKLTSGKTLVSLDGPGLQIASDYYADHELTKFKKSKKKAKMRLRPTGPIDVDAYDGSLPLNTDDTDLKFGLHKKEDDFDEETDRDTELEAALSRARRLRLAERILAIPKVEEILSEVKTEIKTEAEDENLGVVLDSTAEFCRTLGDIPTYGLAGNRDHKDEMMDFELDEDLDEDSPGQNGDRNGGANAGGWNAVDTYSESVPDDVTGGSVLIAEPSLGKGVAGALQLAMSKGYLAVEEAIPGAGAAPVAGAAPAPGLAPVAGGRATPRHAHLLRAANYSIDDKAATAQDADERRRDHHRDRHDRYSGSLQEFREKTNFKPDVKLDYVDDEGRPLAPKEAFRYLSHKFHGKGPGKNKKEKRIKKATQEGLMKQMSSTDTPLGTLALLRQRQEETRSPFVLLSGHKKIV